MAKADKQFKQRRAYIASALKSKYRKANGLTTNKAIDDWTLYKWYYQINELDFAENCSKDSVVDFIYLRLKKARAEQPKPVPKRIIYAQSILDKSRNEFYLTQDWIWLKSKILKLYGCRCMKCGIDKTEMHVDHIIPRSLRIDLQLSPSNLQVLCRECNLEKSNLNSNDYRKEIHIEMLNKFLSRK